MVEVWAVVVLVAGIVMGFSGVYLALAASMIKRPVTELGVRVEGHEKRIGHLEQREAARNEEIRSINAALERIETMLGRHLGQ